MEIGTLCAHDLRTSPKIDTIPLPQGTVEKILGTVSTKKVTARPAKFLRDIWRIQFISIH